MRLQDLARPLWDGGAAAAERQPRLAAPETFARLTRRDLFGAVMEGLEEAARVGFAPIKVNAVALRGFTEGELLDFARLAREREFEVRFIEFMPLDGDDGWDRGQVLTAAEIVAAIDAVFRCFRAGRARLRPGGPLPVRGRAGTIGIIPTVTEPFCAPCNRIRLTADGKLRYCLFANEETDLKTPLRAGATDEELAWRFVDTVRAKWPGHLINQADFVKPVRNMSQIGGLGGAGR